jgi:hypothetical protein
MLDRPTALILFFFLQYSLYAGGATPDFSGQYSSASTYSHKKVGVILKLQVVQKDQDVRLDYSAVAKTGKGPALDGEGSGHINEMGEVELEFQDSFFNTGTGIFRKKDDNFELSLKLTEIKEPSCAPLYNTVAMLKEPVFKVLKNEQKSPNRIPTSNKKN